MSVSDTLAQRAKTYGDFRDIARISGALQRTMQTARNWGALPEDAREALQLIASKIARILNGDPEFVDSWHDIAGYATLVERRLIESSSKIAAKVAALVPPSDEEFRQGSPLACPPDGFETRYVGGNPHPWEARKIGGAWTPGPTRDLALDAAQRG